MKKVAIMGAGSWGTALAVVAQGAGRDVTIWSRGADIAESINKRNENEKYLPGIKLNSSIKATDKIEKIVGVDILLMVVPAQTLRDNCENLRNAGLPENVPLVICCKGVEEESCKLMSEVVAEVLPKNPVAVLSGPNFATEIAMGLPACATLACADEELGVELVEALASQVFRIYYSSDIVGAQVGGAVKNVLAIACGIAIGRGLGENARAALVTRGLAEISRLCVAKGGKIQTLTGLSGIGDVMLSCGSRASRNMSLGYSLGEGENLDLVLKDGKVTEGVTTSRSVVGLAVELGIEMPIACAIKDILFEGVDIGKTIKNLLSRPFTQEFSL